MKPTNYHLFDFLDFDTNLSKPESLWKSCRPTCVKVVDGDIHIEIPFQKQRLDNDMAADSSTPRAVHTLILRQYGPKILRLFMGFGQWPLSDHSEMLILDEKVDKLPLDVKFEEGVYIIFTLTDGVTRAVIDVREPVVERWSNLQPAPQETLDLTLYPDGKRQVRLAAYDHFSPPRYDALPLAYCEMAGQKERATLSFECSHDECFGGTGERFAKMDLSGRSFFLKNQDGQGVNNTRTYKNIPFYVSSRMYGVFFHTTSHSKLDLACHSSRSVQFLSYQPLVDVFVIGGDSVEEIIRGYRDLTGYPSMPPLWSFGVWMSRMTYFGADEVNGICDRLRHEHYPCDVIHLDTGWFRTDWLCEWKFNEERFPEPEKFIRNLNKHGFRVSLWQLPYVAENAEQIDEARANDYIGPLTKKQASEGSNFSALDYAGTIDFTYPAATEWYKSLLRNLLNMGVSCIKTDFGENIHMDAVYKGMKPELLNNLYALLYQKAAYEVTKEATGDGIVWARSAWAGCQRYPLHWGGDSCSSWDGLAGSLKGGLHFGLSGFAFWSHDVPGFHTLPNFMNSCVDDDVYLRWTQFGVFTSHIRYHGTNKREPWHYPAIAALVKRWWRLRYCLIPYIVRESEKAIHSGHALVEAMIFRNPADITCRHIDDQYYFGEDFLVAPVMNSEGIRDIYLPKGEWIDFFTGEIFEGPLWLKDQMIAKENMPVFAHLNSEIPLYPFRVECTDEMDLTKSELVETGYNFKGIWAKYTSLFADD